MSVMPSSRHLEENTVHKLTGLTLGLGLGLDLNFSRASAIRPRSSSFDRPSWIASSNFAIVSVKIVAIIVSDILYDKLVSPISFFFNHFYA
jgi:hypothetical protein